jgi:hypothetical protein
MMENGSKIQTGIFGFVTLAVLVLSIITMAVCFSLQADLKELAAPTGPDDAVLVNGTPGNDGTTGASEDPEDKKPIYVMKIDGGSVVVVDAEGNLVRTVNNYAAFLPADDVKALSDGIGVYTEEELTALIEDFGG